MTRALLFRMVLSQKFTEITNNNPILSQYNTFYKYKYFSFQSAFLVTFQSSPKKSIKSGTILYVL